MPVSASARGSFYPRAQAVDEPAPVDKGHCRADPVGDVMKPARMTSLSRAELGALGEQLAADHMRGLGLRIIARNWRCRYGELDLIVADEGTVVFVEVKTRTSERFGGLAQAVNTDKVRRLRRLAGLWLAEQKGGWAAIRIDVVGIRITGSDVPEVVHLQGVG